MSFAIDGLATGLDTTGIINQLMQIERQPAVALEKRIQSNKDSEKAWYDVRSNLNKVKTATDTLRGIGTNFMPSKASSSLDSVKVTASAGAPASSSSFTVKSLATTASHVSTQTFKREDKVTENDASITFTTKKGEVKTLDVKAGTTMEGLRDLINDAKKDTGVSAALVNMGDGTSRLQLTATKSGDEGNFDVNMSGLAGLNGETFHKAAMGADAVVTMSGTNYDVTSPSNTFTGAVDGLTFTISKDAVGKEVTLNVETDEKELINRVKGMMDAVNEALSDLDHQTSYGIDHKGGKGEAKGVAGKLAGKSTARALRDGLLAAFSGAVPGNAFGSMGSIGIEVTKEGKLEFKEEKFKKALESNPQAVEHLIRGDGSGQDKTSVTARIREFVTQSTDPTKGTVQKSVDSLKGLNRDFQKQVESIDDRVALRRKQLQSQFASMEKAMAEMQKKQSWLMSQLASMQPR